MTLTITRLDPTLAPLLLLHEYEHFAAAKWRDGNTHTARVAEAWCEAERARLRPQFVLQAATQTGGRG